MIHGRPVAVFTDRACSYLDKQTCLCKVYERRFQEVPGCLNIQQAIERKALPNDCPYVKGLDYDGPITIEEAMRRANSGNESE